MTLENAFFYIHLITYHKSGSVRYLSLLKLSKEVESCFSGHVPSWPLWQKLYSHIVLKWVRGKYSPSTLSMFLQGPSTLLSDLKIVKLSYIYLFINQSLKPDHQRQNFFSSNVISQYLWSGGISYENHESIYNIRTKSPFKDTAIEEWVEVRKQNLFFF